MIAAFSSTLRERRGRAGDRQVFALDQAEIGLDPGSLHQRDKAKPALACEQFELRRDVVAADHVEDRVDATAIGEFSADLQEILGAIVDRDVGAVIEAGTAFLVAARGRQYFGAKRLGELDRGHTNSA